MSVWDQFAPTLADGLAEDLRQMVLDYEQSLERNMQVELGPSEIGNPCTRCLARKILRIPLETHGDPWCAVIGVATHAWLDEAAGYANGVANEKRWFPEVRVHPDQRLLPKGGKADLYAADRFTVIDHKVVSRDKILHYKANGPGPQYRNQIHLYGKGYADAGHRVDHVAIAFWHRGGSLRDLYVWTEPYDQAVADACLARYETLRGLCAAHGEALLSHLPTHPGCYDCDRYPQVSADPAA